MRRRLAVIALLFSLAVPAIADENPRATPALRDRVTKIVRIIKKIFLPSTLGDEISVPHP
jgi:hypothetical protein